MNETSPKGGRELERAGGSGREKKDKELEKEEKVKCKEGIIEKAAV